MKKLLLLLTVLVALFSQELRAQAESITFQGVQRTYLVHRPAGYDPNQSYPLVLNFHGLNSNATEQQAYSQFNAVADAEGFVVVYPNAIAGSWQLIGNAEVNFIAALVDTLRREHALNDCLFLAGMSQGGFLTYKLACELPIPVSAVAVVTGNMTQGMQNNCSNDQPVSALHIHGTQDPLVLYTGTIGVPPVETTVQWWVSHNGCSPTAGVTALADLVQTDNSTVSEFRYGDCDDDSEVVLYRVNGGGHTWPGALPIPAFGPTNQDMEASAVIGDFFRRFCSDVVATAEPTKELAAIQLFPNPASQTVNVDIYNDRSTPMRLLIIDALGRPVFTTTLRDPLNTTLDVSHLRPGTYVVVVENEGRVLHRDRLVVIH